MAEVPPPPPPPENPFLNETGGDSYEENDSGLDQGTPGVAARPGRMLIVLGIVGLVLVVLLYSILSGGKKTVEPKKEKPREVVPAAMAPPPLPEAPVVVAPMPTIAPPSLPTIPSIPTPATIDIIKPQEDSAAKQQVQARMRSKVLTSDNTGGLGAGLQQAQTPQAKAISGDPNSSFEASVLNANTKAARVEATSIGNLRRTIAQGRIIQATMESALNTDLPAPIRAIVSRDVYGEAGTQPLIPKGSRLIGTYNTDLTGAQSRVYVIWTRVIRPDGIDIQIGSPLVDQIGQAGVGGQVDTKFQQTFSRALLASVVSIAFAIGSDEISGGTTTTSTTPEGSTTSGDAATTATVNALNRLGAISDSFIQRFVDGLRPTILVDQGTPVNVFVNRDLVFPSNVVVGVQMVN